MEARLQLPLVSRGRSTGIALLVSLLFLLAILPPCILAQSTCDVSSDSCEYKSDGECDVDLLFCEEGSDCVDCDPCREYDFDCLECVSNGCFWCPGDGSCFETPLYELASSECPLETDYKQQCNRLPGNFFSDPGYTAQSWVFDMINVVPVWEQGILGTGVRVRVNDDGIDDTNPEFAGRFDVDASCSLYLHMQDDESHGTEVSSILAAAANNQVCTVGIAPNASLSACKQDALDDSFLDEKLDMFDISQNSYNQDACIRPPPSRRRGLQDEETVECPFLFQDTQDAEAASFHPCSVCDFSNATNVPSLCEEAIIEHCKFYYEEDPVGCLEFLDLLIQDGECHYNSLTDQQQISITNAILNGRNGKGIIFVFAAGNEYDIGEDVNFEGFLNSRFTITVGAVGKDKLHASYSTPGAALFVTAPGGDWESFTNMIGVTRGGQCKDLTVGTSYSSPVISGVVALILEANPELGWRDVQGILASTSNMVDNDPDDDTRITNAAGFNHSNFYGFGIVDALAAVTAAKSWEMLKPEQMVLGDSGVLNTSIPDDPTSLLVSTVAVAADEDVFIAESVTVYLDLIHPSRGDLDVTLSSPHGTVSVLNPGNRPESSQPGPEDPWKLLTVRNWGESANGEWTLSIKDISEGFVSTCADILHWETTFLDFSYDCNYIEVNKICFDGELDPSVFPDQLSATEFAQATDTNGITTLDACCACGGGVPSAESENRLVQWRIVVYGQSTGPVPANVSSAATNIKSTIISTTTTIVITTIYYSLAGIGWI